MIQSQTELQVSDNSGAKTAVCIKVLGGYKRRFAYVGDSIVVSITGVKPKSRSLSKVNRGDVYRAVIIRTKKNYTLKDGSTVSFSNNSVCLLNKQGGPLSTRIVGPILKDLKKKKLSKFINISSGSI